MSDEIYVYDRNNNPRLVIRGDKVYRIEEDGSEIDVTEEEDFEQYLGGNRVQEEVEEEDEEETLFLD